MKKKISYILLIAIITVFAACGSAQDPGQNQLPSNAGTQTEAAKEPVPTHSTVPDEVAEPVATVTPVQEENPTVTDAPVQTEEPVVTEMPAPEETPAATETPAPTPETAILPVVTKLPDEVAQIPAEEREEVYFLLSDTAENSVFVSFDNETKECVLSIGTDDEMTGTFEINGEAVTINIGGSELYFEKVDNGLVLNKVKAGATKVSDRFKGGSLFKKVTGTEIVKEKPADAIITGDPIETKSFVVRTNGYVDGEKYPKTVIITSRAELDKYYEDNKNVYELGSDFSSAITFWHACSGYDDAFFAEKNLVLIVLESGTGMISYNVTGAFYGEGYLAVNIDASSPEVVTSDMAEWHIILETPKTVKAEDKVAVQITPKQADGFSPTEKTPKETR